MKKHEKKPTTTADAHAELPDLLDGLIATLLGTLATAAKRVEQNKAQDPSLVKQVIDGVTELRKLKATQQKRHESLTMSVIVAFLRQCDPDDRARVAREIQAMDRRGGVLG